MRNGQKTKIPFLVELCSDKTSYEVKFKKEMFFQMDRLRELFQATEEYELLVYTSHISIIRSSRGNEITFSKNGRILIRETRNEMEAKTVAKDILRIALQASVSWPHLCQQKENRKR